MSGCANAGAGAGGHPSGCDSVGGEEASGEDGEADDDDPYGCGEREEQATDHHADRVGFNFALSPFLREFPSIG